MNPRAARSFRCRISRLFQLFSLVIIPFCVCSWAAARGVPAGQQQTQPLGSLSTVGNVYVNGSLAPAESTIFSGDAVLTSETGRAVFTVSGKGSFKISPQTHLVFAAEPTYLAEMTSGTVVMTTFAGATQVGLKVGNYVVSPVIETQQSSSRIEKNAVGSFLVACLDGSIGVIPIQGVSGQVLRIGQTVEISPTGVLGTPEATAAQAPAQQTAQQPNHKNRKWIAYGIAGGGAAAVVAAVAARGSHGQPVSPSSM